MIIGTFRRSALVAAALAAAVLPAAAQWAAPTEPPPFRRDRLPVGVKTMNRLSAAVTRLAPAQGEEPVANDSRHAIRALSLALALDPANGDASRLLDQALTGKLPAAAANPADLAWCRAVLAHLRSDGAGEALAACLADILAPLDPAVSLPVGGGGRWSGWVPELPGRPEPEAETVDDTVHPLLKEASVAAVLLQAGKDRTPGPFVPARLSLRIEKGDSAEAPFALVFPEGITPAKDGLERLVSSLRLRFGSLPPGFQATMAVSGLEGALPEAPNRAELEAAAAVLLDSAFRGRPATSTVVVAGLAGGELTVPADCWDRLRTLQESGPGSGSPRRLVLPAEAAPLLPAFLALEKPEFFVDFEVLLASSPEELGSLATADVSPAFREIQRRAKGRDGLAILSQVTVRQSFTEILQAAPQHASARLLLLQASGARPTKLPRPLLAAELLRATAPVVGIGGTATADRTGDVFAVTAGAVHREVRPQVDHLERYADFGDRELHGRVRAMVDELRTLARKATGATLQGLAAYQSFDAGREAVLAELRRAAAEPVR